MYKLNLVFKEKWFLFLFIIIVSCGERNNQFVDFNGNIKTVLTYDNEGSLKLKEVYFENGKLQKVIPYSKNMLCGLYVEYYKDGNIRYKISYRNGMQNGLSQSYYPDGKIKTQNIYKNGILNGAQFYYNDNGKMNMIAHSKNDTTISYTEYNNDGRIIKNYFSIECKQIKDTIKFGETYKVKFNKYGTFGIDDVSIIGYIQAFQNSMKEIKFDKNEAEYSFQLEAKGSFMFILESIVNKKDTVRECSQIFFILPK